MLVWGLVALLEVMPAPPPPPDGIPQLRDRRVRLSPQLPFRLQSALSRVLYVEHPMRTGGSGLCAEWCNRWQCGYPLQQGRNCRLVSYNHHDFAQRFVRRHGGIGWDSHNVTEPMVHSFFALYPRLCGMIMYEPGFIASKFDKLDQFKIEYVGSLFWRTYTTVLLVRDPLERFLSHVSKFLNGVYPGSRAPTDEIARERLIASRGSNFFTNPTTISTKQATCWHTRWESRRAGRCMMRHDET